MRTNTDVDRIVKTLESQEYREAMWFRQQLAQEAQLIEFLDEGTVDEIERLFGPVDPKTGRRSNDSKTRIVVEDGERWDKSELHTRFVEFITARDIDGKRWVMKVHKKQQAKEIADMAARSNTMKARHESFLADMRQGIYAAHSKAVLYSLIDQLAEHDAYIKKEYGIEIDSYYFMESALQYAERRIEEETRAHAPVKVRVWNLEKAYKEPYTAITSRGNRVTMYREKKKLAVVDNKAELDRRLNDGWTIAQ